MASEQSTPSQLLDRQSKREAVGAPAAVLFGEGDAHEAELPELGDRLIGEDFGAVELSGDRRNLLASELTHSVAEQTLLICQLEVHDELKSTTAAMR